MYRLILFCFVAFTCPVLAQPCLPNGIEFLNQASIDAFASDFPDCTVIEGSVRVAGADILSVGGLAQLTRIKGNFEIKNCGALVSLEGLNNLISIVGDLSLDNNASVTSLDQLSDLQEVGSLNIINCSSLTSIDGFNDIVETDEVIISRCQSLQSISGFDRLEIVSDSLAMFQLPSLASIPSFESLRGVSQVVFKQNLSLSEVLGFNQLKSAEGINIERVSTIVGFDSLTQSGIITLSGSGMLDSLEGFNSLISIFGSLSISNVNQLSSLNAFVNIETITGPLNLGGVVSNYLKSFENLSSVGYLSIRFCDFENLDFLSSVTTLTSFGAEIAITFCPNLKDISGLDNIDDSSVKRVIIGRNDSLSICHSDLVCAVIERLGPDDPNIILFDNGPGCNTAEEILEQCALKDDDPMADLCPLMSRPGMQIERIAADNYRILYSYGAERMYMEDIDMERLSEMIMHFKMEKDVLFNFDTFTLQSLCQKAEGLARGEHYSYDPALTSDMTHYVEQVLAESASFITFCQFIDSGECVKL